MRKLWAIVVIPIRTTPLELIYDTITSPGVRRREIDKAAAHNKAKRY